MTWKPVTVQTPPSQRSAKRWKPHVYQNKALEFLTHNGAAALFADPGTGKTSVSLTVFNELLNDGVARKCLVIAPRRVCQLTWWQESRTWDHLTDLRFAWLHDSRAPWDPEGRPRKKEDELKADADVYLMNPEGVAWLAKKFYGRPLPFDTVIVDELTKFKNHRAQRSKALRKLTARTPRLWGLTGSPTPNGYEDLFGQILLLDGGRALGHNYTMFRDRYFEPDGFSGFDYRLKAGADKRIEEKISPMVLRISAADWLDMPQCVDHPIYIDLDDKARKAYRDLKKSMLLALEGGVITAANSGALYSKLAQLANGAVYSDEKLGEPRLTHHVHDAKLDALDDLVEELAGAPLLLGYEFNHDLDRLKKWHQERFNKPLRYLGKGVGDREVFEIERDWNDNKITVLAGHPASMGHGVNLQKGGASHVAWFSATWDFELWDQFIKRVLRQGNTSDRVVNHILIVRESVDELKYAALGEKDMTQARFLQAINTAFQDDPAAGQSAVITKETEVSAFAKLKRKTEETAPAAEEPAAETASTKPKGWGGAAKSAPSAEAVQRENIAEKLKGNTRAPVEQTEEDEGEPPVDAKGAFSAAVRDKMEGGEQDPEAAETKPTRRRNTAKKTEEQEPAVLTDSTPTTPVGSIHIEINYDADGNPVPRICADTYGLTLSDVEASKKYAADLAEIVLAVNEKLVG